MDRDYSANSRGQSQQSQALKSKLKNSRFSGNRLSVEQESEKIRKTSPSQPELNMNLGKVEDVVQTGSDYEYTLNQESMPTSVRDELPQNYPNPIRMQSKSSSREDPTQLRHQVSGIVETNVLPKDEILNRYLLNQDYEKSQLSQNYEQNYETIDKEKAAKPPPLPTLKTLKALNAPRQQDKSQSSVAVGKPNLITLKN